MCQQENLQPEYTMFMPRSGKSRSTLDCEIASLPDPLSVLLTGFDPMALSTASKSVILILPCIDWSSRFLQVDRNFLNLLKPEF